MTFKKISTQFLAFCLIGLLCAEVLFPLQISGQNSSFFQNQFSNAENFEKVVFPGKQSKDTRIVEIRRVRPENTAEFKKLPKISEADLQKLVSGTDVRVVTDKTIAASLENDAKIRESNRQDFAKIYANRPDLIKLMLGGKNEPNPEITLKNGRTYTLLSKDTMISEMLLMRRYLENSQNQLKNYTYLYTKFQAKLNSVPKGAVSKFNSLRPPKEVGKLPVGEITRAITQVAGLWEDVFGVPQVVSQAPRCPDEEGTGNGGDSGEPCTEPNPNGLRAKTTWALENFNTCVRDQGRRGTCSAFGMAAAVESAIAVKFNRFLNLSEQDLYKKQKFEWAPTPVSFYGDGYSPTRSANYQIANLYRYPFERNWDYNKSRKRCKTASGETNPLCEEEQRYRRSCEDYDNVNCSNTNHQSRKMCYRADVRDVKRVVKEVCKWVETIPLIGEIFGEWVCENATEFVETVEEVEVCAYVTNIYGASNFRVKDANRFYSSGDDNAQDGVDQAKGYLASSTPIVFCFTTAQSFRDATDNGGFVTYSSTETTDAGGHCILMTGFVNNEDLPAGVASGAGGGYFIVKNSWGCDFGDQGYAYVPYSWIKKWTTSMLAITDVGP